jgi:predicted membrane channel-forming protein YqfA (hemolysin III family)
MVDNYAHLVGFFFGFLLAFALLPYITFNVFDKRGKLIGIIVCLVAASGFLIGLFALFYIAPLYNCPNCHYFNCLPITKDFCRSMMVEIGRFPWYS